MLPFELKIIMGMEATSGPLRRVHADASQADDDSACDADNAARWTSFLQKHARVLSGELEELFPDFAMDLHAQIHSAQLECELQSSQILQILQQKDAQIEMLEQLMSAALTECDAEVQTPPTAAAAGVAATRFTAHTQCRDDREKPVARETTLHKRTAAMTAQIEEKHEQIEVLLDELEFVRMQLDAARYALRMSAAPHQERATSTETAAEALSPDGGSGAEVLDASTQTSRVEDGLERPFDTEVDPSDARADLSCLEFHLRKLEMQNQDLQMRRKLLLHDECENKNEHDNVQDSQPLAVDSIRGDLNEPPTRFVDHESSALDPNCMVEEHDNRLSRPSIVAKEHNASGVQVTQLQKFQESLDPIEADTIHPDVAADLLSRVLCPDQRRSHAVVQENGKMNPFTQHRFRCSSQFGPSSEESAFPNQQDRLRPAQSSINQGAYDSATAVLHDHKLMEKELQQRAHEQQLEEYVEKIAALTSRNAKLSAKLKNAKQKLQSYSDDNKELLKKLKTKTAAEKDRVAESAVQSSVAAPGGRQDEEKSAAVMVANLQGEVEALSSQLTSREHENLALLQSLSEIKDQHSESQKPFLELENRLSQAKEEHRKQLHDKETEHVSKLNSYMDQVNERLQKLESDNVRLIQEKTQLEAKLSAKEDAEKKRQEARSHVVTVSEKSTETTFEEEATRMAELVEKNRELITQLHQLETQLAEEMIKYEELAEANRTSDQQKLQLQNERESLALRKYEKKAQEIEDLQVQLLEEFDDFKASSDEAAHESEKRIVFLTACVEECSWLVDSPRNEKITTRDIYETVVALSKNLVVAAAPKKYGAKSTKSSAIRPVSSVTPSRNLAPKMQLSVLQASKGFGRKQHDGNNHPRNHQQSNSQESADISDAEAPMWSIRAAKLEQQLRSALLKTSNFEDTTRRLELQIDDLKAELKNRMSKELSLTTKNGLLKAEVVSFKTSFATLSSRYSQVCDELQLRIDEMQVNGAEMARLRSALQRKSDLLMQSKEKVAQLTDDLQKATLKVDLLAGGKKRAAQYLQKAKEQMQLFQSMRRQVEACQANEYQLAREIEAKKERNASFQARTKALRAENADLRLKLGDLRKKLTLHNDEFKIALEGRRPVKAFANATTAQDFQDEVKALRRRVLQKQQLIIAQKSKLAEVEAEIAHLRTKLFDASQINREMQVDQANQKESTLHHVAAIREDLEAVIAEKVDQLDGLRASIYDSLEVFIHCGSTRRAANEEFLRLSSPQLTHKRSEDQVQLSEDALFSMRKWTDLSANDLGALHLQRSVKRRQKGNAKEEGKQILFQVERALEQTPEDSRAEICRALEFLIARERNLYGPRGLAPSY